MPRLQVIDGRHATGIIDPITNMLVEGYAILEEDVLGNPIIEAYFIQGVTYFMKEVKNLIKSKIKLRIHCWFQLLIDLMLKDHLDIQLFQEHVFLFSKQQ